MLRSVIIGSQAIISPSQIPGCLDTVQNLFNILALIMDRNDAYAGIDGLLRRAIQTKLKLVVDNSIRLVRLVRLALFTCTCKACMRLSHVARPLATVPIYHDIRAQTHSLVPRERIFYPAQYVHVIDTGPGLP